MFTGRENYFMQKRRSIRPDKLIDWDFEQCVRMFGLIHVGLGQSFTVTPHHLYREENEHCLAMEQHIFLRRFE